MNETVVEYCPHCETEVEMKWDIDRDGYKAFCPYCGNRLMLCDECQHRTGGDNVGDCDYDTQTNTCRFNKKRKSGGRIGGEIMERFTNREGTGLHESVLRRYIDKGKYAEDTLNDFIKKMACYENAAEDGRLIILPCRPGDAVYILLYSALGPSISVAEVKSIEIGCPVDSRTYLVAPIDRDGCLFSYCDSEFGKIIFLTREAADEALDGLMKGGTHDEGSNNLCRLSEWNEGAREV